MNSFQILCVYTKCYELQYAIIVTLIRVTVNVNSVKKFIRLVDEKKVFLWIKSKSMCVFVDDLKTIPTICMQLHSISSEKKKNQNDLSVILATSVDDR